jgi:alpha-L-fucosidase
MLVDIISKNGTMLLNVLQRPDGSLDDEAVFILEQIGKWFAVCGEGIYGTRPWRVYGEGDSRVVIDGFKEVSVPWNSSDFRFTQKDGNIYAFMLNAPDNGAVVIKSFTEDERVKSVRLLGFGDVPFVQSYGVLTVKLPGSLPVGYANCLKVTL